MKNDNNEEIIETTKETTNVDAESVEESTVFSEQSTILENVNSIDETDEVQVLVENASTETLNEVKDTDNIPQGDWSIEEGAASIENSLTDVNSLEESTSENNEGPKKERKLRGRKKRKYKLKMKIINFSPDNDIRYRGFLSYRGLRALAWVFLIISQVGLLLGVGANLDSGFANKVGNWPTAMKLLQSLMSPLFIMATFSVILNNSRKFSSMLRFYGGFVIVVYALFLLIHDRYMTGIIMKVADMDRTSAVKMVDFLLSTASKYGYFSFNIFVDLFLCTLVSCFLLYKPKRIFVGKYLIIFRLFALLPVAYEITSIILKALSSFGMFTISSYLYPLLTTKPPLTFLIIIALNFYIKKREWLYKKSGKTEEEYHAFLRSNVNSLHFSKFAANQFVVVAFLDLVLLLIISAFFTGRFPDAENPYFAAMTAVQSWGIGECTALLIAAPILLLFSYTRTHKDTKFDLILNFLGLIGLALVYLEGFYQGVVLGYDYIISLLGS